MPDDPVVVDPRYRIIFAWALREAITNVIRHSRATHCVVSLSEREMTVVDDGVGPGDQVPGNGLRGIRERAELPGGEVEVPMEDGRFTVRVNLPWQGRTP